MRNFCILFIVAISIALSSCNEKELICPSDNSILVFSTEAEFNTELQKVSNMSLDEQIAYAKEKGYSSFGVECSKFYKSIDFEGFKSKSELEKFVKENSKYIEVVEDEYGEFSVEQKFNSRNDRIFLNSNHVYQIGTLVYNAFDEGTAIVDSENTDLIYEIGDNVDFFKQDERFVFESNFNESDASVLIKIL